MAILKSIPVTQEFPLETDPEGKARVTFRQASWGEQAERETIFAKQSIEYDDDARGTVRQTFNWTQSQLIQKELFLTLSGAVDLMYQEYNKDGEPKGDPKELFTFLTSSSGRSRLNISESEFLKRLSDYVPPEMVKEMHKLCREVNIQWKSSEGNAE